MVKYILVLGGSNFMGKSLLSKLSNFSEYEVHFINRGKLHWNNEVKSIPNINYTYGNREEKLDYTKVLEYLSMKLNINTDEKSNKWECVVDFCGFSYKQIRSVFNALKGKIKLYLFISTDSIYDVCDPQFRKNDKISEECDIRPEDSNLRDKLAKRESYGDDKLKCEEYLKIITENFPFIILRLPDVIGPYDNTERYWCYVKLLTEFSNNSELEIDNDGVKNQMSFVYSEDVSNLILKLINKVSFNELDEKILYQSYNIGFHESLTMENLLKLMKDDLNSNIKFKYVNSDCYSSYPSVFCGPIDITKASILLEWKPTDPTLAIHNTNDFFVKSKGKYKNEEENIYKAIKNKFNINI